MSHLNIVLCPVKNRICSLGYQLRSLEEFVRLLQDAGVSIVVDVRETAWSRKVGFSKTALSTGLAAAGIEYKHWPQAGNPKSLRENAATHLAILQAYDAYLAEQPTVLDLFDNALRQLLTEGHTPCLVCYERHPDDCHRSYLLQRWQAITSVPTEIEHLAPDGAPRLVKPIKKRKVVD